MNSKNISQFIVKNDGVIDVDATVQNFKNELDAFMQKASDGVEIIEKHVNEFFDRQPKGMNVTKSNLVDIVTINICGEDVFKISDMKKKISQWISDNSSSTKSDKPFKMVKGAKGGISRWSDIE